MRLTELLRADRVVIPLEQRKLSDAIWAMVERLAATGVILEPEALRARIAEGRGEDDYSALATVLLGLSGLDDRIDPTAD